MSMALSTSQPSATQEAFGAGVWDQSSEPWSPSDSRRRGGPCGLGRSGRPDVSPSRAQTCPLRQENRCSLLQVKPKSEGRVQNADWRRRTVSTRHQSKSASHRSQRREFSLCIQARGARNPTNLLNNQAVGRLPETPLRHPLRGSLSCCPRCPPRRSGRCPRDCSADCLTNCHLICSVRC
jgi:hypothetical protein